MLTGRHRYDQIRDLYAGHLASVWVGDPTETTRASFDKKIDSFVKGELEHVTEMLSTFWDVINKSDDITIPSNSPYVLALISLMLHGGTHSNPQVRSRGRESRKLESCEDRPHQVDPRRGFL